MDSSEPSKNKKEEDKPSSSQRSPEESSPDVSFLYNLSPIKQPDNTTFDYEDFFSCDELNFAHCLDLSTETESDINGGQQPSEEPYNTKNSSLGSEEPTTVHQENQAYIQNLEWPSPEQREAESFADAVLEKPCCHDSPAQESSPNISFQNNLSPIKQPDNTTFDYEDFFSCDEPHYERLLFTPPILEQLCETESDFIGGDKGLIEDPYHTNDLILWSDEPTTVHQENQAYVDELENLQSVEWLFPEQREAESFADAGLEKPHCHDSYFPEEPGSSAPLDGKYPVPGSRTPYFGLHLNSLMNIGLEGKPKSTKFILEFSQNIYKQSTVHIARLDTVNERHEIDSSVAADIVKPQSPTIIEPFNSSSYPTSRVHAIDTPEPPTTIEPFTFLFCPETASVHADIVTSESPSIVKPFTSSSLPASVHENKTISTTDAKTGNSEEFNQPDPKKSKKKSNPTDKDTDDFIKKCTCKKSACTKLYCDCFAAELYCTKSCSCQGCLNRSEHEEKLNKIKNQIKFRNPIAFAPRVVQDATDTPSNKTETDNNLKTGRHRSGCRCIKSKCLKNYCECFEVEVGCSSACRCEGCENSYGKKGGHVAKEDALNKEKDSEGVENPQTMIPGAPQGSSSSTMLITPPTTRLEEVPNLELRSSSCGLIKGRKFIIKSVLSFPPLTPTIDSNDNGNGGSDGAKEPERRL